MAIDPKKPLVFELPDGNNVACITWAYVENKLDEELSNVLDHLSSINTHLQAIDDKLDDWVEEN